jgi:hypothetical protein
MKTMTQIIRNLLVLFVLISIVGACESSSKKTEDQTTPEDSQNPPKTTLTKENLPELVSGAINPQFEDWVLFENGTYIVFDNADTISNIEETAIELMEEYGPVYSGGPAGDFNVTHLTKVLGWSVSGHGYGMYTYVHPDEINSGDNDLEIGLLGRSKRDLDGKNPVVVHINLKL